MGLRVLHVMPGLGVGGAEVNLVRLLEACADGFEHQVVDLGGGGPIADSLQQLGVTTTSLNLNTRPVRGALGLRRVAKAFQPDVIQGWLYKGNLMASVAGAMLQPQRLLPGSWVQAQVLVPVLWSVRHSLHAWQTEHPRLRLLIRLLASRPFAPDLVIYNAASSQQAHAELGYARYPSRLLGNFVCGERFRPNHAQRLEQRHVMAVAEDELLVGFVGRLHRLKNLPGFLAAAQQLRSQIPKVRFVLAGQGLDSQNAELQAQLAARNLTPVTQLLGPVPEPAALFNALDLLISPSLSEANSNVLLEATACGCACIATQVGAAAEVLAPQQLVTGAVDTQPSSVQSLGERLAAAALPLLQDASLRHAFAQTGQQRVLAQFDSVAVGAAYRALYQETAAKALEPRAA